MALSLVEPKSLEDERLRGILEIQIPTMELEKREDREKKGRVADL